MIFSEQLKMYRKRKDMSYEAVGAVLGKTKQYAYMLETQPLKTIAPNMDQCEALIRCFGLDTDEIRSFLMAAFQERIRKNLDFYHILHPTEPLLLPLDTVKGSYYHIMWETLDNFPLLDTQMQNTLKEDIPKYLAYLEGKVQNCTIDASKICIDVFFVKKLDIQKMVEGLKSFTSLIIKNRSTHPKAQMFAIWKKESVIIESKVPTPFNV